MSKRYKGYELIKVIEEDKIANETRFRVTPTVGCIAIYKDKEMHFTEGNKRDLVIADFLNYTFEIIEEQQDIDIQEIEEIKIRESDKEYLGFGVDLAHSKINELVQAVKQLDQNKQDKE